MCSSRIVRLAVSAVASAGALLTGCDTLLEEQSAAPTPPPREEYYQKPVRNMKLETSTLSTQS